MIQKIYLTFKITYLCLYYRTLLKKNTFRFCVQQRQNFQPSCVPELIPFTDRQIRRLLRFTNPSSACLLHSLILSHLAGKKAQIYLWIQNKDPFQAHAYLKYQEQIYSTAQGVDLENSILLDNDSCHA